MKLLSTDGSGTESRPVPFGSAARATAAALVGLAVLGGTAGPAFAAVGGQQVCRIGDSRLDEISGMAATRDGYVVVNDGADDPAGRKIFFLDRRCAVVRTVGYPSRPRDTEDLALGRDGTVWVADIGDNSAVRDTVALWRLAPGGRAPELLRLKYPDGAHDAEALLLSPDGTPVIVTKTPLAAGAYVPVGPLGKGKTTALRLAGNVRLPVTTTSNPFSLAGRLVITGGAVSPDGTKAVLRTYADAFAFDVTGGDVVGAITGGEPRGTALSDEPQGESITYTPDGDALLTVSEGRRPAILRYPLRQTATATATPAPAESTRTTPSEPAAATTAPTAQAKPTSASDRAGPLPVGLLVTGALLAAAATGLLLLRRRRKAR
ncbi:hypothetical protein Ade02nite_81110 [Paractinoplanes deccanensis]|uniref:Esterase-like activity of phytase family protein n=1 Tax=Paractinoplanes deccanensis TaxID=113561 RepID=A0ABQ3YI49_9ACTN|nr:hypothetical protein [Actinoplanes deccanensis]GID79470.1 hypothetical protein Ade02nite_81110 [Actinoplanes deccanensis]